VTRKEWTDLLATLTPRQREAMTALQAESVYLDKSTRRCYTSRTGRDVHMATLRSLWDKRLIAPDGLTERGHPRYKLAVNPLDAEAAK
jgi:hypothetical protein